MLKDCILFIIVHKKKKKVQAIITDYVLRFIIFYTRPLICEKNFVSAIKAKCMYNYTVHKPNLLPKLVAIESM